MTEFLTGNSRIAYPLAQPWPSGMEAWTRVLLDATIGHSTDAPDTAMVSLLSVSRPDADKVACRIVIGTDTDSIAVDIAPGLPIRHTVFAGNDSYRALLVVDGPLIDQLAGDLTDTPVSVGIPFDLRCLSSSTRRVTSIATYSAPLCETPVFTGTEDPTMTLTPKTGATDIVLAAKDGIDVESVTMLPLTGNILRVSALAAPAAVEGADEAADLIIRTDSCFTVETLPGTKEDGSGDVVKRTPEDAGGILGGGVIRIGTKCKPCCQCEDYAHAFDALRPANGRVQSVNELLGEAKALYSSAVSAFNAAKAAATEAINGYGNIRITAVSMASGPMYSSATVASGRRKRVAITLTATNMTTQQAEVSVDADTVFTVPGFERVSTTWQTAGSTQSAGESLPQYSPAWRLAPGDTLVIIGTYAKTATTNDAETPEGTKARLTLQLPGKDPYMAEVPVK